MLMSRKCLIFGIDEKPISIICDSLYGQAALEAAVAYNDSLSMSYAINIWDQLFEYVITPENAAAGQHPLRSSAISSTCQGCMSFISICPSSKLP